MQFSMMSSENFSFIYNLNTSLPNERIPAPYAGTDRIKRSHYSKELKLLRAVPKPASASSG